MLRSISLIIAIIFFIKVEVYCQKVENVPKEYLCFVVKDEVKGELQKHYYYLTKGNSINVPDNLQIIRKLDHNWQIIRASNEEMKISNELFPVNDLWKLSDNITGKKCRIDDTSLVKLRFSEKGFASVISALKEINPFINIIKSSERLVHIGGIAKEDIENFSSIPEVTFIDVQCKAPAVERIIEGLDFSTNKINLMKAKYQEVDGSQLGVVVQENAMDFDDIDLLEKVINRSIASPIIQTHATNMATIIGGRGNSYFLGEGVAERVSLMSTDFKFLLPLDLSLVPDTFRTTNHSYGTIVENFYGIEAREYDKQVNEYTDMVHIFSVGNMGPSTSTSGPYAGVERFANLSGNFKQAKNVITVGAIDSFYIVEQMSSKGPAYDGRVKPDFVAYGEDGSSGAAAITSGVASVLQEIYFKRFGLLPRFDLIKAVLMASSDDILGSGPDYLSGYGSINAYQAANIIDREQYFTEEILAGNSIEEEILILENVEEVRVALSWVDLPANENDARSLINDLDLICIDAQEKVYRPLVLNSTPDPVSLSANALPGVDSINNSELIIISDPSPGGLKIQISGKKIDSGKVTFSSAFHFNYRDTFNWEYPTVRDILHQGELHLLRWNTTLQKEATLQWKEINGSEWSEGEQINLQDEYMYWKAPLVFSEIQLRVSFADQFYITDTIVVSPFLKLDAINQCEESLLLQWDRVSDENAYQLYRMEGYEMRPFLVTTENFLAINLSEESSIYYAVQPISADNVPGQRSITINYQFQKPPCYFQRFSGKIIEDINAEISLEFSTLRNIQSVQIYKIIDDTRTLLYDGIPIENQLILIDEDLINGFNIYVAEVQLDDGQINTSEQIFLEYIPQGIFNILQNPVKEGDDFVITKNADGGGILEIYTLQGKIVRSINLRGSTIFVDTTDLPAGSYPYIIYDNDNVLQKGILVII